jgi:hypothetical protein
MILPWVQVKKSGLKDPVHGSETEAVWLYPLDRSFRKILTT